MGLKPCTEGSNPSLSAIRVVRSGSAARVAATIQAVGLAFGLVAATGCVERYLKVETEPIGAHIYINGEDAGVSPVERRFTYYGTVRIDAHLEKQPGVTQFVELSPPWYEYFPLDLFSE